MFRLKYGWYAALAVLFLALPVSARTAPDEALERQKLEMVRGVLSEWGQPFDAEILRAAVREAAAIVGVELNSLHPHPTVTLELLGSAPVEARFERGGRILAVDIFDAIVVPDPSLCIVDGNNLIEGADIRLVQVTPRFVTRLDIMLSGTAGFEQTRQGNNIVLTLSHRDADEVIQELVDVAEESLRGQLKRADAAMALGRAPEKIGAGRVQAIAGRCVKLVSKADTRIRQAKLGLIQRDLERLAATQPERYRHNVLERERRAALTECLTDLHMLRKDLSTAWARQAASAEAVRDALEGFSASIRDRVSAYGYELTRIRGTGGTGHADGTLASLYRLSEEIAVAGESTMAQQKALIERASQNEARVHAELERLAEAVTNLIQRVDAPAADEDAAVFRRQVAMAPGGAQTLDQRLAGLESELSSLGQAEGTVARGLMALDLELERVKAQNVEYDFNAGFHSALLTKTPDLAGKVEKAPPPPDKRPQSWRRASARRMETLVPSPARASGVAAASGRLILAQAEAPETAVTEAQEVPEEAAPAQDVDPPEAAADSEAAAVPAEAKTQKKGLTFTRGRKPPSYALYNPDVDPELDPLQRLVTVDFQKMDISNIVKLLADAAGLNVIAGTDVSGTVTVYLQDVPLGRAIETVLRTVQLGIVEEAGVWRITTYEEAVASRRETRVITLEGASAMDMVATLTAVLGGTADGGLLSITANQTTNVIILVGPLDLVREYEALIRQLDTTNPVIPTRTVPIALGYADPETLVGIIEPRLSESGKVSADPRTRLLVITDLPNIVEEMLILIESLDKPVKQVGIEAMIVDAILTDNSQTGVDWIVDVLRRSNSRGQTVGNLAQASMANAYSAGALGAQVLFQTLSGDFDIRTAIAGEVKSENAILLASPFLVTVENQLARISIAEEIPYQELTQTSEGGAIATTEFKEIGTILEVTPRVTNDDHIIVELYANQSDTKGESVTGVPIEDQRETRTTLRVKNGQTIYIGGLRRFDDEVTVRKTPILGDIPIFGLLFKNQVVVKDRLELMLFLTCNVIPDTIPDLTPYQKRKFDWLDGMPERPDGTRALIHNYIRPHDSATVFYKWRRKK